jgi:hypothetical protein
MSLDSVLRAHYLNSCPIGQLNTVLEQLATQAANGEAMYAHAGGALVLSKRLMREAMTSDLSVIAVQLVESACRARDGAVK